MMVPQYHATPADRMSIPPAIAPQMPMAMSMNGPYALPFRIFPADQPAINPTMIHDRKYIHFSFDESPNYLPAGCLPHFRFPANLPVYPPCPAPLTHIETNDVPSSSHRVPLA